MQTRSAQVHLLNGNVVKLHYRIVRPNEWQGYGILYDAIAEVAVTTKKVMIARVLESGKKPSPWFEILDKEPNTITQLIEWWSSGAAISSIMLR